MNGGSSSSPTPSLLTDDLWDDRLMLRLLARTRLLRSSAVLSVRVLMSSYQAIIVSWLSARNTQVWPRCMAPVCRPLRTNLFEELPSAECDPNFCSGRYRDMTGPCVLSADLNSWRCVGDRTYLSTLVV